MASIAVKEIATDGSHLPLSSGGYAFAFHAPDGTIAGRWFSFRPCPDAIAAELKGIQAVLEFVRDSIEHLAAAKGVSIPLPVRFLLRTDCQDAIDEIALAEGSGYNPANERVRDITHPEEVTAIVALFRLLAERQIHVKLEWRKRNSLPIMEAADRWSKHAADVAKHSIGTTITTKTSVFR